MIRAFVALVCALSLATQAEACRIALHDPVFQESVPAALPAGTIVMEIEVLEVGLYGSAGSMETIARARVHDVRRGEFLGREISVTFLVTSCHSAPSVGSRGVVIGSFGLTQSGYKVFIPRRRSQLLEASAAN